MTRKAIVLVVVLIALAFGVNTMQASEDNENAVVIKDLSCFMLDGNNPPNVFKTEGLQAVITESDNDNINIRCKANNVENPGKKIVKWNFANTGYKCFLSISGLDVVTEDWEQIITPSGETEASCHWNPNPTP